MFKSRRFVLGSISASGTMFLKPAFARLLATAGSSGSVSVPQTPTAVNFSPAGPLTVFNNITTGSTISTASVSTSDSLTFVGTTSLIADAGGRVILSGNTISPAHNFTSADNGTSLTITVQASENSVSVSGNLTLNVVAPGAITTIQGAPWQQQPDVNLIVQPLSPFTGVVTWRGVGFFNTQPANGNLVLQWWIDDQPIGSPITEATNNMTSIYFSSSYDTTSLSNATHVLWGRFIDSDNTVVSDCHATATPFTSNNPSGTYSQAAQDMYVSQAQANTIFFGSGTPPDFLHYGGVPNPTQAGFPMPSINPPGDSSIDRGSVGMFWCQAVCGPRTQEYMQQTFWSTHQIGSGFDPHGVYAGVYNVEASQSTPSAYQKQLLLPYQDGERGDNYVSPFATYRELPSGRVVFVEINGRLCLLTDTGTVTTIAGLTHDKTKLSFEGQSDEPLSESVKIVVGNFVDDIDLGSVQDIAFDPRNENILYLVSLLDHIVIKVDMTGWPGTPATISLWAGTGAIGHADGAPLSATFHSPAACDMDSSGNLWIADQENCLIRKITTTSAGIAGTVSTLVGQAELPDFATVKADPLTYSPESTVPFAGAFICYPSGLRINSTGALVFFEVPTFNCRRINFGDNTIKFIGAYGNGSERITGSATPVNWGQLDIDINGTIGPVDDLILQLPGGLQDVSWRMSTTDTFYSHFYGGGAGFPNFGVSGRGGEFPKIFHYNWAIAISRLYGKFWTSALQAVGNAVARIANSNDPPYHSGDERPCCNSGCGIYFTGTANGRGTAYFPQLGEHPNGPNIWPWGLRPSFWILRSDLGAGHLGIFPGANTFDEMHATYPTDAALGAYIQSGMGGSVPRPELTGNDLRDLIYYIRINTAAGSNYPTVVSPGPTDSDTGNFPTVTSISAVHNANTAAGASITVTWTTDKPTMGFAAGGSASQAALNSWPVFGVETMTVPYGSDGPSGGGLNHTATIIGLPIVTPIHYIVAVRDMAGNHVYTSDSTVA